MLLLNKLLIEMIIRNLFLNASFNCIIIFSKFGWIANQQLRLNSLEESIALKLGRIFDSGIINIGFRLTA